MEAGGWLYTVCGWWIPLWEYSFFSLGAMPSLNYSLQILTLPLTCFAPHGNRKTTEFNAVLTYAPPLPSALWRLLYLRTLMLTAGIEKTSLTHFLLFHSLRIIHLGITNRKNFLNLSISNPVPIILTWKMPHLAILAFLSDRNHSCPPCVLKLHGGVS